MSWCWGCRNADAAGPLQRSPCNVPHMYDNAHFVRLEALVGVTYGVLLIRSGPQHFPLCHVEQRQGQLDLLSLRLLGVAVGGPLPCRSLLGEAVGKLRCCPGFLLLF